MTKKEVVNLMNSSRSELEWNNNCDIVKEKCNGYPHYWYFEIVLSGLMNNVKKSWRMK
jgi:hypothetical protein